MVIFRHTRLIVPSLVIAALSWVGFAAIEAGLLHLGPFTDRLLLQGSPAENSLRILTVLIVFTAAWLVLFSRSVSLAAVKRAAVGHFNQRALQESEDKYRHIVENMQDGLIVIDPELIVEFVNPGLCRIAGMTAEELVGCSIVDFMSSEDLERLNEQILRAEDAKAQTVQIDIKLADGSDRVLAVTPTRLYNDDGEQGSSFSVVSDITERVQAEESLRRTEARLRAIIESAEDSIFIKDQNLAYTHVNPGMARLFSRAESELLGLTDREIFSGLQRDTELIDARVLQGETVRGEYSKTIDGREYVFHVVKVPLRDSDGEVTGICGIARDITERIANESQLVASEERYRTLVDLMPDGISTTDANLNLIYVNRSFCRILGYEFQDVIGRSAADFLDIDNFLILKTQSELRSSGELGPYELTWNHRLGFEVITRISPAPMSSISGERQNSAIVTDVTAYKTADHALRDSEEFSRAVIENSPIGITVRDPRGRLLDYNSAWQRLWDLDEDAIRTDLSDKFKDIYSDRWRVNYLRGYLPQILEVFEKGGNLFLPDLRTDASDAGSAWWVSHYFYAITDKAGSVDRVVIITEDITARKLAEEALRDSEEFSRTVIDNSPIGITVRSTTGRLLSFNNAWQKLWCIPDDDVHHDLSRERDELCFNERDTYLVSHQDEIKQIYENGGSLFLSEIRTSGRRKGAAMWVSNYFYSILDSEGDVDRVVILTEDITTRKQAEEERELLITNLQTALTDIKTLRGLLPICAHCKKIRDDQGYWNKIEAYISHHAEVSFSHGICPDCATKYYPEVELYSEEDKAKVDHEEEPNIDELERFE